LSYLTGLSTESRHILVGQHSSYWDANPMDNVTALISQTGTKPAILGASFGISGSTENGVALANQWIAAGGIADVMWVPPDPANGSNPASNDAADFPDVYTPGTALNATWNGYVDAVAAKAKAINGPFIFRLFPEENGGWFWYGNINPTQMIALWRYTHDRLIADGVTNALWMYNINAGVGNYAQYYPGDAYADIVSWDSYPVNTGDDTLYNALVATGKPIMVAETGASPDASSIAPYSFDNATILATIKSNFPKVMGVVVWCQNLALSEQQGDEAFMTDPAVITLADLPAGL
jgi:hypothetical protein